MPAVVLAAMSVLGLSACQQTPQEYVGELEQALGSGDVERVAQLLTPESRPVYRALVAAGSATSAPSPFAPRSVEGAATVSRVVAIDNGVMIELRVGETQREWVLTSAGGRYRLDLLATATRRPYSAF